MVQGVMDSGRTKRFHNRLLHWDPSTRVAVLVNPIDADGGTVFLSDEQYFNRWGYADMENR